MHLYECTITIDDREAECLNYWLTDNSDASKRLNEDDTIIKTAKFEDGMEMDIKCCGVQFDDACDNPASNTAWTEAVLFYANGEEACHTEVSDEYLGDWEIEWGGNVYRVHVVKEAK